MKRYIITGKAASGKDWLQRRMIEKGYLPLRQHTTREQRENEKGDEYHFVSLDHYEEMSRKGCFISSNFYRIGWYGISYLEMTACDVAILSPANVKDIFEKYPEWRSDFTIIYLDVPVEVRRKRLNSRYINRIGDDNEVRIQADERDFQDFKDYDIKLETTENINNFIENLLSLTKNDQK